MKRHCELVPARTYYGKHATGSVVLVNGHPEFHGKTKDAKAFYNKLTKPEKVIVMLDATCPRTKCPRYDDGCDLPPELCPFNNKEE